jgi:hypothetical protein
MKRNVVAEFLYVTSHSLKNYDIFFDMNVSDFLKYKLTSKLFSKQESKTKERRNVYAYKRLVHFEGDKNIKKLVYKLIKLKCIKPCLIRAILTLILLTWRIW